jgi:hypothetical protein
MRRLVAAVTAMAAIAALVAGSAAAGAATTSPPLARKAATVPITIDVLIRTTVLPTESCCHWIARHSHDGFRDGTVDRCETGDRLLPSVYGVVTRQFMYRSLPPDRVLLDAARTTIVKFPGEHGAQTYYRHYVREGFDCRPRHVDGGTPGGGTAVYRFLHRSPARTVVADKVTESGATLIRKYIDVRPVGRFVAIVEYELGEDIDYHPDLTRVEKIGNAQQRRLERRMAIG